MLDRMLNREIMTVLEYKRINLLNSRVKARIPY